MSYMNFDSPSVDVRVRRQPPRRCSSRAIGLRLPAILLLALALVGCGSGQRGSQGGYSERPPSNRTAYVAWQEWTKFGRSTVVYGGVANGYPREAGFDITVASEVMAIFCLSKDLDDLKTRLGNIIVAYTRDRKPVRARDLKAHGPMTVLLKDALSPNLVQTLENNPAFIHGGPFANIAHGCNSIIATKSALALGDVVVTEAGFGSDLGAEKFLDIKCRKTGLRPSAAVIVATVRALRHHGGGKHDEKADMAQMRAEVETGMANLQKHIENVLR